MVHMYMQLLLHRGLVKGAKGALSPHPHFFSFEARKRQSINSSPHFTPGFKFLTRLLL